MCATRPGVVLDLEESVCRPAATGPEAMEVPRAN